MAFEIMTVTTKGAELLASATSSDNLTIVGCDADDTIYSTINAAKAVSSRPATPLRNTTDVTILFAQNNNLFTRAYFGVGTSATADVNTLYLYGKLDSDSTLYVIAVASSSTSTHLPVSGDPTESFQALFNFMYNVPDTSAVTASSASFATISEFNDLASRVVTTHLQGQSTTGENQNIYGSKTFVNQVNAQSGLVSNSTFQCFGQVRSMYNNSAYYIYMQYTAPSLATIATQGYARIVSKDSNQNDGTSIFKIGTSVSGGAEYYHQELIKSTNTTFFPGGLYWKFSKVCEFDEHILCGKNIMPLPDSSTQGYSDVYIGSSSFPIKNISTKVLFVDEICELSGSGIMIDGQSFSMNDTTFNITGENKITGANNEQNLKVSAGIYFNPGSTSNIVLFDNTGFQIYNQNDPNDPIVIDEEGITRGGSATFNVGSYSQPIDLLSSTEVNADTIFPHIGASSTSVGISSRKYSDVWADNIHGVLPNPDTTQQTAATRYPVGCIILAYVQAGAFTTGVTGFGCGATSKGDTSYSIYPANYVPSTSKFVYDGNLQLHTSSMHWIALSGCSDAQTITRVTYVVALIMRIS